MKIEKITYATPAYQATLDLRNQVMRQPLGLDIMDEDLSSEQTALILGAFSETQLMGFGILAGGSEPVRKVEYLVVDDSLQSQGVGSQLLQALENAALNEGATTIELEARVTAQPFYERHGYHTTGERYLLPHAPVDHILMSKMLGTAAV